MKNKQANIAALLDRDGDVIGEVYDAPETGEIKVAGAFTTNNDPVNVRKYRISRSKRNLKKAQFCQPVDKVGTKSEPVWTFHFVEDDVVVY